MKVIESGRVIASHTEQGVPIKAWTEGVEFDENALQQCRNLAQLPFVYKHVAVMPDVHFGIGATVGTVFATEGAIIPAAVGVDIGCGMLAQRTDLSVSDLPDSLEPVRAAIEKAVPVGTPGRGTRSDEGSWHDLPRAVERAMLGDPGNPTKGGWDDLKPILAKHPKLLKKGDGSEALHQCGTLGGGNHFIELCSDEEDRLWVMLHSGSRGIGNKIGSYFIELAREDMRKHFINLPDKDLAYLCEGTQFYTDYLEAVQFGQDYAHLNRQVMLGNVNSALEAHLPNFNVSELAIACHHNYVTREHHFGHNVWVTRKGAVRAREGDLGIIPGSMGTRSYIVRGLGNPDSFTSCSHGAGRRMSRGAARRTITVADHVLATQGVECRKDEGVLDESPSAYKDIDQVIEAEKDLVEIIHTLKGLLCVKG